MKTIGVITDIISERFLKRLTYTINFINNHPYTIGNVQFVLNQRSELNIFYGSQKEILSMALNNWLFECEPEGLKKPFIGKGIYNNIPYFIPRKAKNDYEIVDENRIHFDLFEAIFFFISRIEEVGLPLSNLDELGRVQSWDCFAVQNEIYKIPNVDLLVQVLLNWTGNQIDSYSRKIELSHDIDELDKFPNFFALFKSLVGSIKRREPVDNLKKIYRSYRENVDPYNDFGSLLIDSDSISKKLFIPAIKYHFKDPNLSKSKETLKSLIELGKAKDYEIGIHGSIVSSKEKEYFNSEINYLKEKYKIKPQVNRFHYLMFSWVETPIVLEQSGIKVDHTLGWSDVTGYRCGTAAEYHLYNFSEERAYNFKSKPMVCMDIALMREASYNYQNAIKIINELISYKSSDLTFNFHNSSFFNSELKSFPLKDIYNQLFNENRFNNKNM